MQRRLFPRGPSDVNQGCLLAIIGSEMWEIRDGAQILSACRLESICHYHEMSMEEKKKSQSIQANQKHNVELVRKKFRIYPLLFALKSDIRFNS